jgi:hypothetical protein
MYRTRLLVLTAIGIAALGVLAACSPAATPTPKPTPTPNLRAQVVTFLKALEAVDVDAKTWVKDFSTFMQYSAGLNYSARQSRYQELLTALNTIKNRALAVQRPPVDKARAVHDAYSTLMSKLSQMMTLLQPSLGQGVPADAVTSARVQGLFDELTLTDKQLKEAQQDLVAQFNITSAEVDLK